MCMGYFMFFMLLRKTDFLVSRISNHLMVKSVIMHKIKGFSRAIRDEIELYEE